MIKIRDIEQREGNLYFVIYEINKKVYSYNGTSEDVLNDLFKTNKEIKEVELRGGFVRRSEANSERVSLVQIAAKHDEPMPSSTTRLPFASGCAHSSEGAVDQRAPRAPTRRLEESHSRRLSDPCVDVMASPVWSAKTLQSSITERPHCDARHETAKCDPQHVTTALRRGAGVG